MGSNAFPDSGSEPPPLVGEMSLAAGLGLERWPEVRADLAAGRGLAGHARLLKLRRAARSQTERDAIDAVLSRRRLFAEPATKAPALGRVNSVGAGMYGGSQRDERDGSYVKTRMVSFVWMPVFPIDQWLVRDAENGGWHFLARIPMDLATLRLRQVAAAFVVLSAVAVFAAMAWSESHR